MTRRDLTAAALPALRIYAGLVWLTYGMSKFEPDWAGGKREFLSAVNFAASSTGEPFRSFLHHVVIPNQAVFANLIAFGETLVGISLILGLLTKAGALGGAFLAANYYFATGRYSSYFGIESIELMLFALSVYLLIAPSGASFSLDAFIKKRR